MPTYTEDMILDDGVTDSPALLLRSANDDEVRLYLKDNPTVGHSDGVIKLADVAGNSRLEIQDSAGTPAAWINSDGGGYFAGKAGLNIATPETALHIRGPSEPSSRVTIARTDAVSSGAALLLRLDRSGAGVDDDVLGQIIFQGYNDAGTPEQIDYATIVGYSDDVSDGSEYGGIALIVYEMGTPYTALRIKYGRVGIGTEDPSHCLHVSSNDSDPALFEFYSSQTAVVRTALGLKHTTSEDAATGFGTKLAFSMQDTSGAPTDLAYISAIRQSADDEADLSFALANGDNPTEVVRLTQEGYLGIGTAPSHGLHLYGTSETKATLMVERVQNVSTGPAILLRHSRGAAGQDGDHVGYIRFYGYNDDAMEPEEILYAQIVGILNDASDGTENGSLLFQTSSNGSTVTGMAVVGGKVGIGTIAPAAASVLHVYKSSGDAELRVETGSGDVCLMLKNASKSWALGVEQTTGILSIRNESRSTTYLYMDPTYDRVGVFVGEPQYTLDVNGITQISGNPAVLHFEDTGANNDFLIETASDGLRFKNDSGGTYLLLADDYTAAYGPLVTIGGTYEALHVDTCSFSSGVPCLGLEQNDDDAPFICFFGMRDAGGDITWNLVQDQNADSAVNHYVKVEVDDGNDTCSGTYYIALHTLSEK